MKVLKESVIFGSDKVSVIKKVLNNSSMDNIDMTDISNADRRFIEKLISDISGGVRNANPYIILSSCVYGGDTSKNTLLGYIIGIRGEESIWKYPNKINQVLSRGRKKEILLQDPRTKKVPVYLLNTNLYTRSDTEFDYTIKAFDAIIDPNKRKRYFKLISENPPEIQVDIDEDLAVKFFGSEANIDEGESEYDLHNDGVVTASIPLNEKYLYSNMQLSYTDDIIPAGMNNSNSSERTIWNYMEIWSNSKENDSLSTEQEDNDNRRRSTTRNRVSRAVEKIKTGRLDDEDRQFVIDTIRSLM